MREIKFRRAHFRHNDSQFECFTYWGPIKGGFQSPSSLSHCYYNEGTDMQYTGLKDKNGKEIYEGDIIDYGDNRYRPVEFINGCFCICKNTAIPTLMTLYPVIGNIYENPELLNQQP